MVRANESVAKLYMRYPFLYRVHEEPDAEDVEKFMNIIEAVGDTDIASSNFQDILELLKSDPKLFHFQKLLLRSLSKARYSEKNVRHFGLALRHYSHFTSPIRRYPDLQIHRIIKELSKSQKGLALSRKEHYVEILPKVALRSSETADRAEKMEYKVRDMLACRHMQDKVGESFE